METYQSLQMGANTLKQMHKQMDVEDVETVMKDIQEASAIADEIGEALSNPMGGEIYDEDELEDELAELMAGPDSVPDELAKLPTVPTNKLPEMTEEEELKELEALMS